MGLNTSPGTAASKPESSSLQALTQNAGISLLDDELASLGKHKKKRKNSWLVSINVEDQALNKQKKKTKKKKVSSACTAQGHFRPQHKKTAPFRNMAYTTPDIYDT